MLFSGLASKDEGTNVHAFLEWINPITADEGQKGGIYLPVTGVSAATLTLFEILARINGETSKAESEKETMPSEGS